MLASTALCASILLGTPGYVPAKLYRFKSGDNLAKIAKLNNTGYERLTAANPDLKPEKIREGTVIVIPARLPKNFSMTLASTTGTKPAAKVERKSDAYYVRNGDNDWTIAPKFGITPSELRKMNPTVNWGNLKVGQPLRVPLKKKTAPANVASNPAPKAGGSYVVKSGDNDWIIARRLGITPAQLRTMNPGVNWSALQIGKTLKAPGKASSSASKNVAAATNRINTKRVAVNRTDVTVRALPNTGSRKVTLVDRGLVASVLDRKDGWYKLRFSTGLIGWVRGDMLKEVSAKEAIRSAPSRPTGRVASNSRPSTKAPVRNAGPSQTVAMGKGAPGTVIGYAKTLMGTRYRWGGTTSRGGFDCSGFTSHVFAKHGVRLPRTSSSQSQAGQAVSRDGLKTGDLVFFKTGRSSRVNHVGIYIGGGKFIHSSSGGGKVQINSLNDGYYNKRYAGGRRVSGGKSINVKDLEKEASVAKKADPKPKPENTEKVAEKTTSVASTSTAASTSTPPATQNTGATSSTVSAPPATEGGERASRVQIGADGIGR